MSRLSGVDAWCHREASGPRTSKLAESASRTPGCTDGIDVVRPSRRDRSTDGAWAARVWGPALGSRSRGNGGKTKRKCRNIDGVVAHETRHLSITYYACRHSARSQKRRVHKCSCHCSRERFFTRAQHVSATRCMALSTTRSWHSFRAAEVATRAKITILVHTRTDTSRSRAKASKKHIGNTNAWLSVPREGCEPWGSCQLGQV
ncbi:hypothetical protein K466DRAFT_265579 [Polyporus arcularius HHB13444]|uniref:Uncharacterized protein n=1 Tax=Polyporus arcularius HHB13444 TaxID=1314778 RepID=A0A5C3PQI5_9APHY|nr:hypothetical protein K466DRAFT_265579 [Polyporus arcularius HHB13444]